MENMESETNCRGANLNPEDIITNYNSGNHLIVRKQISSLSFLNANLLQIMDIYYYVCK